MWESRQVALSPGENIVNRAPDASVWIDAPGVSRHHARIVLEGTAAAVEDLGSKTAPTFGDSVSPLVYRWRTVIKSGSARWS